MWFMRCRMWVPQIYSFLFLSSLLDRPGIIVRGVFWNQFLQDLFDALTIMDIGIL